MSGHFSLPISVDQKGQLLWPTSDSFIHYEREDAHKINQWLINSASKNTIILAIKSDKRPRYKIMNNNENDRR